MPRYLIVRKFDVTQDAMPQVGRKSRVTIEQEFPEITWEHSHVVVDDDGVVRTYCIYAAPDEQAILDHSSKLGQHEIELLKVIAGDVSPADFPG
jgi:ligand-binding SRPBCC domain-containing protein